MPAPLRAALLLAASAVLASAAGGAGAVGAGEVPVAHTQGPSAPPAGPLPDVRRCAPSWWQPERDFADRRTCSRGGRVGEIAAAGGVVLLGSFWDVAERRGPIPPPLPCEGDRTHARNREFIRAIREARPPGAPPIAFVHLHRFDLVPASLAAQPGFRAEFLVRTRRPWSEVLDFFRADATPLCRGGQCAFSDSFTGDPTLDAGGRLRDHIDRAGGAGSYRSVVYYLSTAAPGKRVQWPNAALGNLGHPGYRAWRVAEAARAIEEGGYDAVLLNEKFSQYRRRGGHWIGDASARNVEQLNETGTTLWTAPPDGYGYAEYREGWSALARDLASAGVPYAVWLSEGAWRSIFARPGSAVPEDPLLAVGRGASLVLLHSSTRAEVAAGVEQDVRAHGGRLVLRPPRPDLCGGREAPAVRP